MKKTIHYKVIVSCGALLIVLVLMKAFWPEDVSYDALDAWYEFIKAIGVLLIFIISICAALSLYLLPSIVALERRNKDKLAIFILNLLLGWTLLFWVISLVWAVKKS